MGRGGSNWATIGTEGEGGEGRKRGALGNSSSSMHPCVPTSPPSTHTLTSGSLPSGVTVLGSMASTRPALQTMVGPPIASMATTPARSGEGGGKEDEGGGRTTRVEAAKPPGPNAQGTRCTGNPQLLPPSSPHPLIFLTPFLPPHLPVCTGLRMRRPGAWCAPAPAMTRACPDPRCPRGPAPVMTGSITAACIAAREMASTWPACALTEAAAATCRQHDEGSAYHRHFTPSAPSSLSSETPCPDHPR